MGLAIGEWDIDKLMREMPMPLFREWMQFWELEPFGDSWRQTGMISACVRSMYGCKGKQPQPDDFMPNKTVLKEQTAEQAKAMMIAVTNKLNASEPTK